jgi:hypothetical protein
MIIILKPSLPRIVAHHVVPEHQRPGRGEAPRRPQGEMTAAFREKDLQAARPS